MGECGMCVRACVRLCVRVCVCASVCARAHGRRCMTCDEYLVGEGFSAGDFGCRIVSIPTDADNDDVPDGMSMFLCGFERLCLCIAEPSLF